MGRENDFLLSKKTNVYIIQAGDSCEDKSSDRIQAPSFPGPGSAAPGHDMAGKHPQGACLPKLAHCYWAALSLPPALGATVGVSLCEWDSVDTSYKWLQLNTVPASSSVTI